MMPMTGRLLLLCALAACGPQIPDSGAEAGMSDEFVVSADEAPGLPEECDADAYRGLVGTPIAAASVNVGPRLRVYAENDLITQEFLPQRTNIVTDTAGTVIRAYCG